MFGKNRLQIKLTLLFVCITMLFTTIVYGSEDQKQSFYTFASNFQRTSFVETNNELDSFEKNRTKDLLIPVYDYQRFGTVQWMIQDADSLYFHTDLSIVKINKETLEVMKKPENTQPSDEKDHKVWYGSLTYSQELDVLIDYYFQGDIWNISIMNPDTLEEIQSISGFGFSAFTKEMGVIVWNKKIIYLDYEDDICCLKSLTIGESPETIYVFPSTGHIDSAALYNDCLYATTKSTLGRRKVKHSILCIDLPKKALQWEHEYPIINEGYNRVMSHPVCTSNGVFMEYFEHNSVITDFLDLETGSLLWSSKLPDYTPVSTLMSLDTITANEEQICIYVKTYEPWDMDYVSKIVIISQKDGTIQREYLITKNIEEMVQVNNNLLLTLKDGKWIASLDTNSGQIKARRSMEEGTVLSNIIVDKNKIWCLISKEDGNIALLEME